MMNLAALAVAMVLGALAVTVHFSALNLLRRLRRLRQPLVCLILSSLGLLLAHVFEIWLYAGAYELLQHVEGFGSIVNQAPIAGWFDSVYYSAMVYTTVGFGDMLPAGPMRVLTASEALVGLALITWSASFTFMVMDDVWD